MKPRQNNTILIIIAIIAVVNALGYGIIIPILYSFSHSFGLSDFQNGLLFSVFSLFQFISTPVIGRLSDKYGRKPLLIISLAGTAFSFLLMAFARSGWVLFVARALDGITAGNIPVASAVISDTTTPEERAKGFGIIGASFGFGFIFGPAISALTIGYGYAVPFLIAAAVSFVAVLLTAWFLPETNKHMGLPAKNKMFDFAHLARALFDENVGLTLLISLLYTFAFSLFIYSYQPFSVKVLALTPQQIAVNFTLFGIVGLVAQGFFIPRITKKMGERQTLSASLGVGIASFIGLYLTRSLGVMIVVSIVHASMNAFVNPLIQALLSKETDAHSQGSILGINASYQSIGMIVGPIVGGAIATTAIPLPFLAGSVVTAVCLVISLQILRKHLSRPVAI